MADEGCSKKEDEIDFGDDDEIDFGEEDVTSCPDGFIVCTSEGDSVSGVKVVESPQSELHLLQYPNMFWNAAFLLFFEYEPTLKC